MSTLFAEIGKKLDVKIEWVTLPLGRRPAGPRGNWFDMVAGPATITKGRMERYRSAPVAEATVEQVAQRMPEATTARSSRSRSPARRSAAQQDDRPARPARGIRRNAETRPDRDQGKCELQPMPTSPPPDRRGVIPTPTSPATPSAPERPSRWSSRRSAPRPISASRAAKRIPNTDLMDAIDVAILKMKADGRLAAMPERNGLASPGDTPDSVTDPASEPR